MALADYASAAPLGVTFAGSKQVTVTTPSVLGLNEVGVTDAVMATMWRCGPLRSAASTTGPAEKHHFGSDIAIVDRPQRRLILYQAKLGSLDSRGNFDLKSPVSANQVRLLQQAEVSVAGTTFAVTGRLAIYQTDHLPYTYGHGIVPWPGLLWPWQKGPSDAIQYFDTFLGPHSFSPCGVMAAAVSAGNSSIRSVPAKATWPWEFDTYHWVHGFTSYVDLPSSETRTSEDAFRPQWVRGDERDAAGRSEEVDFEFAADLRRVLGVPSGYELHVLMV